MFGRKQLVIDNKELEAKVEDLRTRKGLAMSQVSELKVTMEAQRAEGEQRLANRQAEWEKTFKDLEQAHAERLDELEAEHLASFANLDLQAQEGKRAQKKEYVEAINLAQNLHGEQMSYLRQGIAHRANQNKNYRADLERLNKKYIALKHQYNWVYDEADDTWTNEYFHLVGSISKRSGKWDLMDTRDSDIVGKSIDYSTVVLICNARSKDRYFGADD